MSERKVRNDARLNKAFEEAHEHGAKEFGALWLDANEAAVEAALFCGADQSNLQTKTLLSLTTLKILRRARRGEAKGGV